MGKLLDHDLWPQKCKSLAGRELQAADKKIQDDRDIEGDRAKNSASEIPSASHRYTGNF